MGLFAYSHFIQAHYVVGDYSFINVFGSTIAPPPQKKDLLQLKRHKANMSFMRYAGINEEFFHTTCKINICFRFEADNNEQAGTGENGERCCFSVVVFGTKRASLC